MSPHHAGSVSHALFRVFVLPTLSKPALQTSRAAKHIYPQALNHARTRSFSQSVLRPAKTRAPEARRIENEQIKAYSVHLVDSQTGTLGEPRRLTDILETLDPKTHRLVQFELHGETRIPVCKIISKRDEYENAKRRKAASKEAKKQNFKGSEQGMKTLELNWAIDQNDLGHRLDRFREFLEEGRRVEIVLAGKKRGRKATREECQNLLERIRAAVDETPGAKEKGEMEGKIGGVAKLTFIGKLVKRSEGSSAENGPAEAVAPASDHVA